MIWLVGTLGLGIGFLAGIAFYDALDLYRSSRKGRRPMLKPSTYFTRRRLLALLIGVIVLMQASVGVLLIITYATTSKYTECSATWQQQFGTSYRARAKSATKASDALDRVVRAVAMQDSAGFKKALHHYVAVRDRQDAKRRSHPLPQPPDDLCGEPRR